VEAGSLQLGLGMPVAAQDVDEVAIDARDVRA
jgi:hypothetical protein